MFFLLNSSKAHANDMRCVSGKMTSMSDSLLTTKKAELCFLHDLKRSYFVSKKCEKECEALQKKDLLIDFSDLFSQFGKPGFKLCQLLGGTPQLVILTLKDNPIENKTDQCVFKDQSSVSTDYLMEIYL